MYLKKVPEFLTELMDLTRINRDIIEGIFESEIEQYDLLNKVSEARKIYQDDGSKYYNSLELGSIIIFFTKNKEKLNITAQMGHRSSIFIRYLKEVHQCRNSIAHNKYRKIHINEFSKILENSYEAWKLIDQVYPSVIKNKYIDFLNSTKQFISKKLNKIKLDTKQLGLMLELDDKALCFLDDNRNKNCVPDLGYFPDSMEEEMAIIKIENNLAKLMQNDFSN